jgi:hypothetical protein
MRIDAGLYQKTPAIDLLTLVKNPAVATAACCERLPTVVPAWAAAPQGVAFFDDPAGTTASVGAATISLETGVPGNSSALT